jgi:hypothetical protein
MMKKPAARAVIIAPCCLLVGLGLFLVAFIEIGLRIPLSGWLYALVGALGLFCALITMKLYPIAARRTAYASIAFVVVLLVLFLTPWTTRKVFLEDFRQIDPEMTAEEVSEVMAGYEMVYKSATAMSFRHSHEPRYDSDVGLVYLEEGKVVRTEYSPD